MCFESGRMVYKGKICIHIRDVMQWTVHIRLCPNPAYSNQSIKEKEKAHNNKPKKIYKKIIIN